MADPSLVSYLPLWQSLVGSLGAFGVAAFTVWLTNRHARARDAEQARRARELEGHRVLREKLEELVDLADDACRQVARTGNALVNLPMYHAMRHVIADDPVNYSTFGAKVARAQVIAQLYFPSLRQPVEGLLDSVLQVATLATDTRLKVAGDFDSWTADEGLVFKEQFMATLEPCSASRQRIIDEARTIVTREFGLKVGGS